MTGTASPPGRPTNASETMLAAPPLTDTRCQNDSSSGVDAVASMSRPTRSAGSTPNSRPAAPLAATMRNPSGSTRQTASSIASISTGQVRRAASATLNGSTGSGLFMRALSFVVVGGPRGLEEIGHARARLQVFERGRRHLLGTDAAPDAEAGGALEIEHERCVARRRRIVDDDARLQRPRRVDGDDERVAVVGQLHHRAGRVDAHHLDEGAEDRSVVLAAPLREQQ